MRLPDPLYQQVKTHMAHHAPWHFARFRREWIPAPDRPAWDLARQQFPNVKYLDEVGCGEEFLRFHRVMIRHFKWIVSQTPQAGFTYRPWEQYPAWLETQMQTQFSANYLRVARERIAVLVETGTADQLGNFLEATGLDNSYGSNLHNRTHGAIAVYEETAFPGDVGLQDASMGSPDTAHHNEHFWGLHGWIDEVLAAWQRTHHEAVDQTPLDPSGHGHMHPFLLTDGAETPFQITVGLRHLASEILNQ